LSTSGCEDEALVNIFNKKVNQSDTSFAIGLCKNIAQTLPLTSNKTDSISWSFSAGEVASILNCINCPNPELKSENEGILIAEVKNYKECIIKDFVYNLYFPKIEVPNVFSPNNDGENDLFRPVKTNQLAKDSVEINQMIITNRWGKEVYNSNKPWNGEINNNIAPEEVYYFLLNYKLQSGCIYTDKGNITLIR